jgi:hypothetical protein
MQPNAIAASSQVLKPDALKTNMLFKIRKIMKSAVKTLTAKAVYTKAANRVSLC